MGLLECWYTPTAGSIFLDGRDITELNLQWLRTNVRLVQQVRYPESLDKCSTVFLTRPLIQEPVLFNGSVFENISYGLVGTPWESASQEEQMQRVQEAARLAFAHDFIQSLPENYHTRIGERGGLLSGGQKQRIAIARSIVSQPKILLLDEATSALDPHAEGIVQKALDSASENRTTVVIAHKLSTIRNADNIVVMSKGKIVEQGNHEELVSRNGTYSTLVKAQDLVPANMIEDVVSDGSTTADQTSGLERDRTGCHISLKGTQTVEDGTAAALKDREDHELYTKLGILRNTGKLIIGTRELWPWFAITAATCVAGGESTQPTRRPRSSVSYLAHHAVSRSGCQSWPSPPARQHP